jgi:lysophospholipase L1-like esterase
MRNERQAVSVDFEGPNDGGFAPSCRRLAERLAVRLLLGAGGALLAVAILLVVDRFVAARALPKDEGLVVQPWSRVVYDTEEFHFTARINRLGFRGREWSKRRVPGRIRILAIGDSFTYGWGVALDETWPKRLEKNLSRLGLPVEIADLGKVAADPVDYAKIASRAVPEMRPDLVIVGVAQGDDLEQLDGRIGPPNARSSDAQPQFLERVTTQLFPHLKRLFAADDVTSTWRRQVAELLDGASREEHARFARLDRSIQADYRNGRLNPGLLRLALWRPDYFSRHQDPRDPATRALIARMSAQLRRIAGLAQSVGASVLVVSVPNPAYGTHEDKLARQRLGFVLAGDMLVDDGPDESIRQAAEAAAIPSVSFTKAFRRDRGEELFFPLDGHLNREGHALLAECLTPAVVDMLGGTVPLSVGPRRAS